MKRALASIAIISALARLSEAGSSSCPSFVHRFGAETGRDAIGVTPQQAKQIMNFVKSVPGIHHHVEFVDALNWPEVTVETGPHGKRHGDILRLRLDNKGHWHVLEKSKWNRNEPLKRIGLTRRWSEQLAASAPHVP
jgi:hypothetical protein